MWRIYTTFGLIAASLSAYASIPAIVTYYVKDALVSSASSKSLVTIEEYIVLFALFLFIVARLYVTISLHEEKENAFIKALASYAQDREERVKESILSGAKNFVVKPFTPEKLEEVINKV